MPKAGPSKSYGKSLRLTPFGSNKKKLENGDRDTMEVDDDETISFQILKPSEINEFAIIASQITRLQHASFKSPEEAEERMEIIKKLGYDHFVTSAMSQKLFANRKTGIMENKPSELEFILNSIIRTYHQSILTNIRDTEYLETLRLSYDIKQKFIKLVGNNNVFGNFTFNINYEPIFDYETLERQPHVSIWDTPGGVSIHPGLLVDQSKLTGFIATNNVPHTSVFIANTSDINIEFNGGIPKYSITVYNGGFGYLGLDKTIVKGFPDFAPETMNPKSFVDNFKAGLNKLLHTTTLMNAGIYTQDPVMSSEFPTKISAIISNVDSNVLGRIEEDLKKVTRVESAEPKTFYLQLNETVKYCELDSVIDFKAGDKVKPAIANFLQSANLLASFMQYLRQNKQGDLINISTFLKKDTNNTMYNCMTWAQHIFNAYDLDPNCFNPKICPGLDYLKLLAYYSAKEAKSGGGKPVRKSKRKNNRRSNRRSTRKN